MECQSCLNDSTVPVVADASVAINLNATGCPRIILNALPNRFVVVEQVVLELEAGQQNGRNNADGLNALADTGQVEIVCLGNFGFENFTKLVSGPTAQTLDDGEAATIAYALEHEAIALIDERKANRLCDERFATLTTGCTIDLFAHTAVGVALGHIGLSEAVFNALHDGRMRVPSRYYDWVINLIGSSRARECLSLPKSVRPR